MNVSDVLEGTVRKLLRPGTGILAADESLPTIAKRFVPLGIAETEEMRRAYRSLLFATPGIDPFIGGAILFEETLLQRDGDGKLLPEVLERRDIVPGIKVDKGTASLVNAPGDLMTQGLCPPDRKKIPGTVAGTTRLSVSIVEAATRSGDAFTACSLPGNTIPGFSSMSSRITRWHRNALNTLPSTSSVTSWQRAIVWAPSISTSGSTMGTMPSAWQIAA